MLLASVQTLRDAFTKVEASLVASNTSLYLVWALFAPQAERSHPGLSEEFLSGLLRAEGTTVDLPEALLRLAYHDGDHYTIPSDEKEFVLLNEGARGV